MQKNGGFARKNYVFVLKNVECFTVKTFRIFQRFFQFLLVYAVDHVKLSGL